jgi:hypothetical protein
MYPFEGDHESLLWDPILTKSSAEQLAPILRSHWRMTLESSLKGYAQCSEASTKTARETWNSRASCVDLIIYKLDCEIL